MLVLDKKGFVCRMVDFISEGAQRWVSLGKFLLEDIKLRHSLSRSFDLESREESEML